MEEFQSNVHKRPSPSEEGWRISISSGSQDAINKVRAHHYTGHEMLR